jgi:hypothetical protein
MQSQRAGQSGHACADDDRFDRLSMGCHDGMAAGFSTRRARHSLEIIAWQLFDSAFTHGSSRPRRGMRARRGAKQLIFVEFVQSVLQITGLLSGGS